MDQKIETRNQKLEIPKFNGTNPRLWIKQCSKYFEIYKIQEDDKVEVASRFMVDKAKDWISYYMSIMKGADWTDIILDLTSKFKDGVGLSVEEEFNKWYEASFVSCVDEQNRKFDEEIDMMRELLNSKCNSNKSQDWSTYSAEEEGCTNSETDSMNEGQVATVDKQKYQEYNSTIVVGNTRDPIEDKELTDVFSSHRRDSGIHHYQVPHNYVVNMYEKCGSLSDARHVFDDMPARNFICLKVLFPKLLMVGLETNYFMSSSVLETVGDRPSHREGRRTHGFCWKCEYEGSDLVDIYARCELMDERKPIFDRLLNKNEVSWNALVACRWKEAAKVRKIMGKLGLIFGMMTGKLEKLKRACKEACHDDTKYTVGITMFGGTPHVTSLKDRLNNEGCETLVWHATGVGGKAMEDFIKGGFIQDLLYISTAEVADQVVGSIMVYNGSRFIVILDKEIPFVLSIRTLDMVNVAAKVTVPGLFLQRKTSEHANNAFANIRSKVYVSLRRWYVRTNVIEAQSLQLSDKISRQLELLAKVEMEILVSRTKYSSSMTTLWNEELMFVVAEPCEEPLILSLVDRQSAKNDEVLRKHFVSLQNMEKWVDQKAATCSWFNLERVKMNNAIENSILTIGSILNDSKGHELSFNKYELRKAEERHYKGQLVLTVTYKNSMEGDMLKDFDPLGGCMLVVIVNEARNVEGSAKEHGILSKVVQVLNELWMFSVLLIKMGTKSQMSGFWITFICCRSIQMISKIDFFLIFQILI